MDTFLRTYQKLTAGNLQELANLYTEDIRFIDPVHEIKGLNRLTEYFANLYSSIGRIGFQFSHQVRQGAEGYVQWQMTFTHPRLKKGREIVVPGASYLHFTGEDKVNLHQDYFDLGAMLYEHLPMLGGIISTIKRRLSS